MDKLRFGIVGCGEIAIASAKAISEAQHAEIGMVMDVNERIAKELAEKYGVPYTTNLDRVLSSREVDAVYTPTPHHLHAPIAIQAARMGKHVMVEKPIATNLADATAMIRECKENKVSLSVAFTSRYGAETVKAREIIKKGIIAKIFATEIRMFSRKPQSYWQGGFTQRVKSDWRKSKETSGGGVLIMNCVHNIDRMRYVTGLEAATVFSEYGTFNSPSDVEVEDTIAVLIRYTNGTIGWIEAGSSMEGSRSLEGSRLDAIYGTEGQILIAKGLRVYTTKDIEGFSTNNWQETPLERTYNPRTRLFEEFARSVLSGNPPPITGEDGLKALEIIYAAYRSREVGRPISLPMTIKKATEDF